MKRRKYIATISAAVSGVALAGCSSDSDNMGTKDDCTVEQSTDSVEPVPVTVDGQLEDATADTVLELNWNARAQDGTQNSPDSNAGFPADEGEKTMVFRVEFINNTEQEVPMGNTQFDGFAETPDTTEEVNRLSISAGITRDVILKPDGRTKAYMVYEIPDDSTDFTLRAISPPFWSSEDTAVAFNPNCDRELSIELGEFSV